jgi:hypothetical protein
MLHARSSRPKSGFFNTLLGLGGAEASHERHLTDVVEPLAARPTNAGDASMVRKLLLA